MSKSKKSKSTNKEFLMVTTGIRNKAVFVEIECPDNVVCGKVLAICDLWIDEINPFKEKGDARVD